MQTNDVANLTPHEFLERLQRDAFGGEPPPFAADVGDVMTASLLSNLPIEHQRALEDIAIGVLPTGDVNAFAIRVPGGGDVIGFNYGLLSFLLALDKLLMSRAGVFSLEPLLTLDEVRDEARMLADAFKNRAELKRRLLAPRRMMMAASLSSAQIAFIVGHELGHVLMRHLEVDNTFESSHEMEFAADARGAEMVIGTYLKNSDPLFGTVVHAATMAAPDIFFTYQAFAFNLTTDSPTHPSALTRRERLRGRFWKDLPQEARALAGFAEKVFAS